MGDAYIGMRCEVQVCAASMRMDEWAEDGPGQGTRNGVGGIGNEHGVDGRMRQIPVPVPVPVQMGHSRRLVSFSEPVAVRRPNSAGTHTHH